MKRKGDSLSPTIAVWLGGLGVVVGLTAILLRQWPAIQPGQGAVVGGFAVLTAAVITYASQHKTRKQDAHHHNQKEQRERENQFRNRFTTASDQIANSSAAIRLAGIYGLTSLSDDWLGFGNEQERDVCINLLRAYLRTPFSSNVEGFTIQGESEVRHTLLEIFQARIGTYRPDEWTIERLDRLAMSGCQFDNLALGRISIRGSDFSKSVLQRLHFLQIILNECDFSFVEIHDSDFEEVHGEQASFLAASFTNCRFSRSRFSVSSFTSAEMTDVVFDSSTLRSCSFTNTSLGMVSFEGADLRGADFGGADLHAVNFKGAILDGVRWHKVAYDSTTQWPVGFVPPPSYRNRT
ncbi:pentapeptide repeat-containing protein [Nocardia kruczakiae]|nr:pentapeptide repeat-containing protein [Nocardia kruczakiae]